MTKTAVVIGSTGLVGSALVEQLIASDLVDQIITLTRRPDPRESSKVSNHVVDFEQLSDYEALFAGDLLFSCLGTTIKQAGSIQAQRRVDLDYQYEAARLAAKQGVSHYLLVSSSGANARSPSPYMKMKGELEEKVKDLAFTHISILQPSLLLGEREQMRMAENIGSLILPALCKLPGLSRYTPIRGSEVAQKMLEVAASPSEKITTFTLDEVFPN